jgi:hypothetical protein
VPTPLRAKNGEERSLAPSNKRTELRSRYTREPAESEHVRQRGNGQVALSLRSRVSSGSEAQSKCPEHGLERDVALCRRQPGPRGRGQCFHARLERGMNDRRQPRGLWLTGMSLR